MIRSDNPPLSLSEVLGLLYQARYFLLGGLVIGCVVAFFFLVLLKPQYEIWMIIAPPRQGAESVNFLVEDVPQVLSPMAGQATSHDGEYVRFGQSLRGPAVASVLIKMEGMTSGINNKSLLRGGHGELAAAREVAHHLGRSINLEPLSDTESLRLVYHHPDAEFGMRLLRNLVKIDDQLIRLDVRKDVEARIDWLKRELKSTLNPEHRQALTRLLMAEERRRMLLSIETPYAVSVIEDATASPEPVSPKATLFLPFFGLFGMAIAFLVFYARNQSKREI